MLNEDTLEVLEVTSKYHFRIFLENIHDVPKLIRIEDCKYYLDLAEAHGFIENLDWTLAPDKFNEVTFCILNDASNPIRRTNLGEQVLEHLNNLFPTNK